MFNSMKLRVDYSFLYFIPYLYICLFSSVVKYFIDHNKIKLYHFKNKIVFNPIIWMHSVFSVLWNTLQRENDLKTFQTWQQVSNNAPGCSQISSENHNQTTDTYKAKHILWYTVWWNELYKVENTIQYVDCNMFCELAMGPEPMMTCIFISSLLSQLYIVLRLAMSVWYKTRAKEVIFQMACLCKFT